MTDTRESTAIGSERAEALDSQSTFSSESAFYGDERVRKRYEEEEKGVDTEGYWRVHDWNIQVVAARAVAQNPSGWPAAESKKRKRGGEDNDDVPGVTQKKQRMAAEQEASSSGLTLPPLPTKPFNPYQGKPEALQLNETIQDFLQRLKPSSGDVTYPWIWCAYFDSGHRDVDSDISSFKQVGTKLLEKFLAKRQRLGQSFDPPKAEGAITRMMSADRQNLEEDIMLAAKRYRVNSGKWMLFPTCDKVDMYWDAVVRGTVEGRLGVSAKVATRPDNPREPTQVICVYTQDKGDEADIKRVLLELVRLKLAPAAVGPLQRGAGGNMRNQIWYKPDCYTYLDITSGNEYKIKPTLYGTAALLRKTDLGG